MQIVRLFTKYADAILAMSILVGGIMWLTAIYDSVAEATRANVRQDQELREQMALLRETHDGVIELKAHFNVK